MRNARETKAHFEKTLAAATGLACGCLFFLVIAPLIVGEHLIVNRGAFLFFVVWLFPLLIVPSVCLIVAGLGPKTRKRAFQLGAIVASTWLLPLPIVDAWKTIPVEFGFSPLSRKCIAQITFLGGVLVILSGVAAASAGLVSHFVYEWISRRRSSQGK